MPTSLTKDQRKLLSDVTLEAREEAETAARAALENLAVHEHEYRAHMTLDQRQLRNRLRARGRALGDRLDQRSGTQAIDHLAESAAYEHWHRLLFTRFLAENHLLHTDEALGTVPVTLEECDELAAELGVRDGFDLACRFASQTLPGIFRRDDPVLELRLAPNHEVQLRQLLDRLPAELFRADDALGWTYQFWQAAEKKRINDSGVKIGADELPAVTQLFTEDYMVEFLLHNTLGAWWAGKRGPVQAETEQQARSAVGLPAKDGLLDISWDYLRFIQDDGGSWRPAAGTFGGWPKHAAEIRLLDPCMGSGHFLVFALPILARLRTEEEGLGMSETVAAVLRDNLHGLEIDERCTQIAAFNVALTAWRLVGYHQLPAPSLACSGLAPHAPRNTWVCLAGDDDRLQRGLKRLHSLFREAPVLRSLINLHRSDGDLVEADFHELQPLLAKALEQKQRGDDEGLELRVVASGLTKAAEILSGNFDLVVTNVPYRKRADHCEDLRSFADRYYPNAKADLANVFIARCVEFANANSAVFAVTPQNWLFLASYRKQRRELLAETTWSMLARLGPGAFREINGHVVKAALLGLEKKPPTPSHAIAFIDVSDRDTPEDKSEALTSFPLEKSEQRRILATPDSRVKLRLLDESTLLEQFAIPVQGLTTGDNKRFVRFFFEVPAHDGHWVLIQSASMKGVCDSGREFCLLWEHGQGDLTRSADARIQGLAYWKMHGVTVSQMIPVRVSPYFGGPFDMSCTLLVAHDRSHLPALWAYCTSTNFNNDLAVLDQKMNVTTATVGQVPFEIDVWRTVASEEHIHSLPRPFTNEASQWIFHGHPRPAGEPLHVAVARLLGYRWPAELDQDIELSKETSDWIAACGSVAAFSDADGIVCLPPINKEQPAAARLRNLLAAAFGSDWSPSRERDLLAATGAKQTNMEDWLRDTFFEQHCRLFKNRPFVWHLWDGRKDGFHALVNYHRLDYATLQKLTYSYLGDWIRQQDADAKADKPSAAERLGAAQVLEAELIKILEGEPPYDIFIRWKPIQERPLGWQPDLNDGVRLNIRPFMLANDVGRRGAGILRFKPNVKWDKDRGKEPHREKAAYPCF
jgi:hypothetical protein